jgi:predicted dehydrogenase
MYKALLIGCGNIGALYDFANDHIHTHAKAYYLNPDFNLTVYDPDLALSGRIAQKYNSEKVEDISIVNFSDFDCISICSPTESHFSYLKKAIKAGVKVIICEKPLSYHPSEVEALLKLYYSAKSNVIINYFREFQPEYHELKQYTKKLSLKEPLTNISIRYHRGFINNGSHAFNLLQFLFDKQLILEKIHKTNIVYDHFKNDPTFSLQADWGGVNFNMQGLTNTAYSFFEMDIFFKSQRISITDAGATIKIYKSEKSTINRPLQIQKRLSRSNCLDNYMEPVINHARTILNDNSAGFDNFIRAVATNRNMLSLLNG